MFELIFILMMANSDPVEIRVTEHTFRNETACWASWRFALGRIIDNQKDLHDHFWKATGMKHTCRKVTEDR